MLSLKCDYVYLQWVPFILRKYSFLSTLDYGLSGLVMEVMKVLAVLWCLTFLLWDSHLLSARSLVPLEDEELHPVLFAPFIQMLSFFLKVFLCLEMTDSFSSPKDSPIWAIHASY